MYAKLFKCQRQFVCLELASAGSVKHVSGCLIEVQPEYVTMAVYDADGSKTHENTFPIHIVVGLIVGHQDEKELQLKACWAVDSNN